MNLTTQDKNFMLYKQLINYIVFSFFFIQTACNNTHQSHMLPHTNLSQQEISIQDSEEKCSICLDPLHNAQELIIVLRCRHGFHEKCILDWIRIKCLSIDNINTEDDNFPITQAITCPLCRTPITNDPLIN